MEENHRSVLHVHETADIGIIQAKDCFLYDTDGKQYLDFEAGVWCANLGHSHERISRVLGEQGREIIHLGYRFTSEPAERLSSELLDLVSFRDGKSVFLSSGSEAVNLAITFARELTGRKKILTVRDSYLGAYGHAGSAADNPEVICLPFNDNGALGKINFNEIAAFVFEPGTSSGSIRFPSMEFINASGKAARKSNCYLVADEVTTGFGRTGRWFGFGYYDLEPDMVACGKAMGNGYPISAVALTAQTAAAIEKKGIRYVQSHQNDPLGCAVALEVIDIFREQQLIRTSQESGKLFRELLEVLAAKYREITEVRGRGLMLGMEFRAGYDLEPVREQLLDKGFIVGTKSQVMRFLPPLTIRESDIIKLVKTLEEIL
jgi:acetylornithine/N-succinyldiaminopimelate aminotransferase